MLAPAPEKATVVWPARLLCEVKDVQDEMNILRSIVTQQKQVRDTLVRMARGWRHARADSRAY